MLCGGPPLMVGNRCWITNFWAAPDATRKRKVATNGGTNGADVGSNWHCTAAAPPALCASRQAARQARGRAYPKSAGGPAHLESRSSCHVAGVTPLGRGPPRDRGRAIRGRSAVGHPRTPVRRVAPPGVAAAAARRAREPCCRDCARDASARRGEPPARRDEPRPIFRAAARRAPWSGDAANVALRHYLLLALARVRCGAPARAGRRPLGHGL